MVPIPEDVSSKSKIFKIEAATYRAVGPNDEDYKFELKPNGDFVVPAGAPLEDHLAFLAAVLKNSTNTDARIVSKLGEAVDLFETLRVERGRGALEEQEDEK
jgi:hypothetical protein